LINNERIKLTATWLNTIAATTIATGVVAPVVAVVFRFTAGGNVSGGRFVLACAAWFRGGIALHFFARRTLRRLQQ
jgi:hypothetical protein